MIQFNLLPDVKLEYIKARRLKRLVVVISSIVAGAALVVFIFLLILVYGIQKKSISDLSNSINSDVAQVEKTPNLNKILTVQNQLESLPKINSNKPVVSRLFTFISKVLPATATVSSVNMDFTANTVVIDGNADSIATINTFVDILKNTTYSTTSNTTSNEPNAFSSVVLTSFGLGTGTTALGPSYEINASFDPTIFSESNNATLNVPTENITRTELGLPTAIFNSPTSSTTSSGTN